MLFIGLFLAIFVGTTLGMLGSGGSILTVPIFVYIFKIDPVLATAYSMFAICINALVGGIRGFKNANVDMDKLLKFGIPSMISVFVMRKFIVPLIPDEFEVLGFVIHQSELLMVIFAILMLFAGYAMYNDLKLPHKRYSFLSILSKGVLVGSVTGGVGAGGGFLIVPALTNIFNLEMRKAVSTSLVLISINSFLGLMGDTRRIGQFDWTLLLGYTSLMLLGLFFGFYLSNKIESKKLKRVFGIGIILVGVIVLLEEFKIL